MENQPKSKGTNPLDRQVEGKKLAKVVVQVPAVEADVPPTTVDPDAPSIVGPQHIAELRSASSMRTTFSLTERGHEALKWTADACKVSTKDLLDHAGAMLRGWDEESPFLDYVKQVAERQKGEQLTRKTFVLSDSAYQDISCKAANLEVPRDALLESAVLIFHKVTEETLAKREVLRADVRKMLKKQREETAQMWEEVKESFGKDDVMAQDLSLLLDNQFDTEMAVEGDYVREF